MANTTGESEIGSDPLPPRLREPLLARRELDTRRAKNGGHVDAELDAALGQMGRALVCMGLDQSTGIRVLVAWLVFLIIGIGMPAVNLWATSCKECRSIQNTKYEVMVQISQIAVAAISLVCISRNLRKYGLEKFLLLDQYPDRLPRFCHAYVAQLCGAFKLLKQIILPCFIVKIIREVLRIIYIQKEPLWENVVILISILISWLYLTTIFLSSCALFNLVCNLLIIHFEDYANLLEGTSNVSLILKEHMRLRYQLYKISHRFRIYILLVFLVVTASQLTTLFETTNHSRSINFLNAGDFAVCTVVQLVAVLLCLRGAAKVSHRAQSIASIASKWHALATCNTCDMPDAKDESNEEHTTRDEDPIYSPFMDDYESDLESSADLTLPSDSQLASVVISYHKRQALVMYFQLNHGGITIFGFNVDRVQINTIFFIEFSLVLWILGKTIVAT